MVSADIQAKIIKWAEKEPLVNRVYLFGSRVREEHRADSDLDIAVEINKPEGDGNVLATWICEGKKLKKRLSKQVQEYEIDLQCFDGDNTPVVRDALLRSSYMIYGERHEAPAT